MISCPRMSQPSYEFSLSCVRSVINFYSNAHIQYLTALPPNSPSGPAPAPGKSASSVSTSAPASARGSLSGPRASVGVGRSCGEACGSRLVGLEVLRESPRLRLLVGSFGMQPARSAPAGDGLCGHSDGPRSLAQRCLRDIVAYPGQVDEFKGRAQLGRGGPNATKGRRMSQSLVDD